MQHLKSLTSLSLLAILATSTFATTPSQRQVYFGDLHVHTANSFDAYVMMGTRVDLDTAYRFAKGETIDYLGTPVVRDRPLDFMAITDHAENIGFFNQLDNSNSKLAQSELGKRLIEKLKADDGSAALKEIIKYQTQGLALPGLDSKAVGRSTWQQVIDTANYHYQPSKFTSFIGYEWTAMLEGANLHRNVIFKGDNAPAPFSSADSRDPEDLWKYLEAIRENGHEALAIPHNSNASNGLMFDWTRQNGEAINKDYAQSRRFNEPLSEIAQNKGTSETHPLLSPDDEFAGFEIFDTMLTLPPARKGKLEGSYMREALGRGMQLEQELGINPYGFGFIGSSDLHSGLSDSAEKSYSGNPGKIHRGGGKPTPEQASNILVQGKSKDVHTGTSPTVASSGTLTGVWAEENTRDSLYQAIRRKEVFATSGTYLKLRFFAGWAYDKSLLTQANWLETAYAKGVAMGSTLEGAHQQHTPPQFIIQATKDPDSAGLDRAQIIKVWFDKNSKEIAIKEKIYDVAWSGDRRLDQKTGKLPPVQGHGASELYSVWTDPDFDPSQPASYYLRVLETPTPRWSTLLAKEYAVVAKEYDLAQPDDVAETIQERGWSSPIWYSP